MSLDDAAGRDEVLLVLPDEHDPGDPYHRRDQHQTGGDHQEVTQVPRVLGALPDEDGERQDACHQPDPGLSDDPEPVHPALVDDLLTA